MKTLRYGDTGPEVIDLQTKLKRLGFFKGSPLGNFLTITTAGVKSYQKSEGIEVDGVVGPITWGRIEDDILALDVIPVDDREEIPEGIYINPAYLEAKKHAGKKESDKKFSAYLVPFWKKVGLPNYKTLIGTSFAWCALFFVAMNTEVGQDVIDSAGAKKAGQSGYEINWKQDGIPQGAGVWKNSKSCSSGSGNHITWADGDCTATDLRKPGATWAGFGGNQGNAVKRSIYCAKGDCSSSKDVICRVFWHKKELPPPVRVSKNCTGTSQGAESTR